MYSLPTLLRNLIASMRRPLRDWSSWTLAPLGIVAFCITSYWSLAVGSMIDDLLTTTNDHGFTPLGVAVWCLVGLLGVSIWFFGCIAARCHLVIFERHF